MQRECLALELHDVQRLGRVVDERDAALGRGQVDEAGPVLIGVGQAGDQADLGTPTTASWGRRGWLWSTAIWAPSACTQALVSGRVAVPMTRQLHQHRPDTARCASDLQRLPLPSAFDHAGALKQQLPGGDRRQRQRGRLGIAEAGRRSVNRPGFRGGSTL